jgi:hypothetical protein
MIGRPLSLTCLVARHQAPRGCPSAESDTHEECLRAQPAASRRPGRGYRSVSRAWRLRRPLFSPHNGKRTSTLNRCLVQPQAVTSTRNQVSRNPLARMIHQMFFGRPLRPRDALVYPLDTGGLIGVRSRPLGFSSGLFYLRVAPSCWSTPKMSRLTQASCILPFVMR